MSKPVTVRAIPKLKETLSLTNSEAAVLLPIIRGGNMTIGAISQALDVTIPTVNKAIKSLETKGLVEKIEGVVPVYRALPPILPMTEALATFVEESEDIRKESEAVLKKQQKSTDTVQSKLLKTNETQSKKLNTAFEKFEAGVAESVKGQIVEISNLSSEVLTTYSQRLQEILEGLNASLDTNLGEKLSFLQTELDKGQKDLQRNSKKIAREFDKWLKQEQLTSAKTLKEVESRALALTKTAKSVMHEALNNTEEILIASNEQLTAALNVRSLESSNSVSELLTKLFDALRERTANLDTNLGQTLLSSQSSLEETTAQARSNAEAHSDATQRKLDEAVSATDTFTEAVTAWKKDVNEYMGTASQSVLAQLDQLSGSENAFIEVVNTSLTGFVEKTNASVNDEYKALRGLSRGLTTETESFMNSARNSVLDLLQGEVDTDQTRLQTATDDLTSKVEKWNTKTSKNVDKKVIAAVKEISGVLDTEAAEFSALADNMASRLKSSFSSVRTTTETKNEASLQAIKRSANEYETSLETKLAEIAAKYIDVIQQEVAEAKVLYESLNSKLNDRLSQSTSTMNSQVARTQKEIDVAIGDQVSRIDRQTEEMRQEFHVRIEEITRQFLTLTQSVESTFNGLLSSQTVEARDLIASAHTEFRSALTSEMATLDEDSLQLQQEFASEIGAQVNTVVESTAALKRTLDAFTAEKKNKISKSMTDTITGIEETLHAAQASLAELETGTVGQFVDNMQQVTKEFNMSLGVARDNVSERLTSIRDDTSDLLVKNAAGIRTTVDIYISEEKEAMQRIIGATSTRLDALAASNIKKATGQIDAYQIQLESNQAATIKEREKSRKSVMKNIANRKSETVVAFDAAQVWIESAMSNVNTSLDALGTKMSNEILHVRNSLDKTAESAVVNLRERNEQQISQIEEIGKTYLNQTEAQVKTSINDFSAASEIALNSAIDSLAEFPERVTLETENASKKAIASSKERLEAAESKIVQKTSAFEEASKASCNEVESYFDRVADQVTRNRDTAFDEIQQATVASNQHASRKLESVGVELKASLSSSTYELMEGMFSEVNERIASINDASELSSTEVDKAVIKATTARTKAITDTHTTIQESTNNWGQKASESNSEVSKTTDDALLKVAGKTKSVIETLNAIHSASSEIVNIPTKDTWYISGNDEICAQILDMSKRAEESIIVSVVSLDCLDLKKLSKIRVPLRRVLVIPQSEDPDIALESLKGWRIWETNSPITLAIRDDTEILVGGQAESDAPLCIVSTDESYIKLYHDSLGPKLVRESIKN
ncbi:MAG: helix-turn-helix domain-containing protein [Candidatus Thorarchaeota archaeon]